MFSILVRRVSDSYWAVADNLREPLHPVIVSDVSRDAVVTALWSAGWYQQDMGDALDQADRDWKRNQLAPATPSQARMSPDF